MKRINWLLILAFLSLPLRGQRNADYGLFGGVSSYIGDINPGKFLYKPQPAGGIFYRYNFHPRQAIRTNLFFGGISGDDSDFKNDFQQARDSSFDAGVVELAAQFEFNFLPYSTQGKRWNYTPYFAGGAGVVAIIKKSGLAIEPVIPFSLGFKINIFKNVGLEAEYGFRKTFYDNFDGLKDPVSPADHGWIHNNDWYTFTGISVTWKFYNKLAGCPAYDDVSSKKRKHY
jgi:hypothetical protein